MCQHRPTALLIALSLLCIVCSPEVCGQALEEPPAQPPTVFPHSQTAPWWVSGQINVIFQGHPSFHALYSGPNSLHAQGETATSHAVTLYTGYQFNSSTEVLFAWRAPVATA